LSVAFQIFYVLINKFTTGTLQKIQGAICKHIPALKREREGGRERERERIRIRNYFNDKLLI